MQFLSAAMLRPPPKLPPLAPTWDPHFYVTGGTLRIDAPSYVERQADLDLIGHLRRGEYCYVLTSRQMGKSSLMVRTAHRLRAADVRVAVLDLTAVGQNVTPEQWYDGLLVQVGRQLRLDDELEQFWLHHASLGPCQRFFTALRELLVVQDSSLVVFVDEIDTVRSLPFSSDEFFAAIRECYSRRTEDPPLERLSFCLLGVATPSDLINDVRMTPFNIARRVELRDFTETEASPLAAALGRSPFVASRLLRRILYWTGGHPYLTQRLCQAVGGDASVRGHRGVDRVCRSIFLSHRARERDDNLLFVRDRILRSDVDRVKLLRLYRRVHRTTRISGLFRFGLRKLAPVSDEETNPLVTVLNLSGITRVESGILKVRNRIYYLAFDGNWIISNTPEVELWRVWVQFLSGLKRIGGFILRFLLFTVAIALIITFTILFLRPIPERPGRHIVFPHASRHPPEIPARSVDLPAHLIDLSPHYNAGLHENWHEGLGGSLAPLTPGVHRFHGIDFDVRGVVQLAGSQLLDRGYPSRVEGLNVNLKAERIHFLHATGWREQPGTPIATYVIRYANRQQRFVPVIYAQDVMDWYHHPNDGALSAGVTVAWETPRDAGPTSDTSRRLYLTSWQNPLPDTIIESIDYVSWMSRAAPFLVAITLETHQPESLVLPQPPAAPGPAGASPSEPDDPR
jgi:hypothetical protein